MAHSGGIVTPPTRVLIVDDHQVFTDALAWRLEAEPDLDVVGVAHDAITAVAAVDLRRPDVVILDVDLGEETGDGVDLIHALRESRPEALVIMLTAHDDATTATRALRAGARGFIPKDTPSVEVIEAVRAVVAGETRLPPLLLTDVISLLRRSASGASPANDQIAKLTAREREILELMVTGMDREAIARRLILSINTVRTHNKNILAKLGVHSSLEAVSAGLRAGLRPELDRADAEG